MEKLYCKDFYISDLHMVEECGECLWMAINRIKKRKPKLPRVPVPKPTKVIPNKKKNTPKKDSYLEGISNGQWDDDGGIYQSLGDDN